MNVSHENDIRAQVRARFGAVARDPSTERRFRIGRASALALGFLALLGTAGFHGPSHFARTGYQTSPYTFGAAFRVTRRPSPP
jgi:hypothetical protein